MSLVDVTIKAEIGLGLSKMYFVQFGGEVTEGEYKGTSFNTSISNGTPIIYVQKDGKHLGSFVADIQSLIGAAIDAVESAAKEA